MMNNGTREFLSVSLCTGGGGGHGLAGSVACKLFTWSLRVVVGCCWFFIVNVQLGCNASVVCVRSR